MITKCLEINEALRLTPVAPEAIPDATQRSEVRSWIDLADFTPDELAEWLDRLAIDGLGRRLCLEARDRAGFYPLKREIFFVIPLVAAHDAEGQVDHIALLCRENLLLTLRRKAALRPETVAELKASESWLSERSTAGLASALLITQSLQCLRRTADLRGSVVALEMQMEREPDAVEAGQILDLRAELVALEALVKDQLPPVRALSAIDRPFFRLGEARDFMNCALANLEAAEGSLSWLGQRVDSLHSASQMHAQDKTNRRLGMLTILSAIFMPMTLLAGIWGMNFENMPELKFHFAYPLALVAMALIGMVMYRFFRRSGWFD